MTKEELKAKVAKQQSIINLAKKDGTRSNREFVLWNMEIDNIKKID